MTLNDQTLKFSKPIGFIMNTQKNRMTKFWNRSELDLEFEENYYTVPISKFSFSRIRK